MQADVTADYLVSTVRRSELWDIYSFLFSQPDPNMRSLTPDEVDALIQGGFFLAAWEDETRERLAATCYMNTPPEEEGLDLKAYELGGSFTRKDLRGQGLGRFLAMAAIANLRIGAYERIAAGVPLIGHVISGNSQPVGMLRWLGFERIVERKSYDPNDYPGLDHMPLSASGVVHADIWQFGSGNYERLIRLLHDDYGFIRRGKDVRLVEFKVAALRRDVLMGFLQEC